MRVWDDGGFTQWLHEQHTPPSQRSAPNWGFCKITRRWFYGTSMQIWLRGSLPRCLGQSYLNIYVPMSPWAVTPMNHVAVPSLIRQSKHRFTVFETPLIGAPLCRVLPGDAWKNPIWGGLIDSSKELEESWLTRKQPVIFWTMAVSWFRSNKVFAMFQLTIQRHLRPWHLWSN